MLMEREQKILKLREARVAAGLSQGQLAEKIGVVPGTVSNWEVGTREPDLSMLRRLAEVLGVSVDALLEDEGRAA